MSKLPKQYKFIDISDYGRPFARWIASALKNTRFNAIHVTYSFFLAGLIAIYSILTGKYLIAAVFLIIKSILDAADGELARLQNKPSYTGRYLDSIADIILNLLLLLSFWHITHSSLLITILAFFGLQLQGTLYNYYYVIQRNTLNGDKTSRILEDHIPQALEGEKQSTVNILYRIYDFCYISFDKIIYALDQNAVNSAPYPNWFMSMVSSFGLGFQLLIMSIFLSLDLVELIIPFFIYYSLLIVLFIGIRRTIAKGKNNLT